MNIPVIYEDDQILIIDKPAGITVNKSETTVNQLTVQDWTENKLKVQSAKSKIDADSDFYKRAGIVHRLDKETSGILIIAKKITAFENMQKQFKERTVKKVYIALAHGKIVPAEGKINVPVGRLPWSRKQFGILPGGRESVTLYKVLRYFKFYSQGMPRAQHNQGSGEVLTQVELYPQSGRTHQIRVHLKYINHPVFSDFLYAGRKTSRQDRKFVARVFLHAAKIYFTHPATGEIVSYESPLPSELLEFLEKLSKIE